MASGANQEKEPDLPKGTVPNLIGLAPATAQTTVTSAGFIGSASATTPINDPSGTIGSGNLNKVTSQTQTANTVLPAGQVISFTVSTPYFPPFFPPFFPPYFPPYFPPFFPPYFPPYFPPFFPPYFPPYFPPFFPPYFPPYFPPFFPPYFPPFFPPQFK